MIFICTEVFQLFCFCFLFYCSMLRWFSWGMYFDKVKHCLDFTDRTCGWTLILTTIVEVIVRAVLTTFFPLVWTVLNFNSLFISQRFSTQSLPFSGREQAYLSLRWKQLFANVLQNFAIFTGKRLCWSFFLIKLKAWNIGKFWGTVVFTEHLR